jgi:hypothetical protein
MNEEKINMRRIEEAIENYERNRRLAMKHPSLSGAVAFCTGAIWELDKILRGEY